MSDQDKTDRPDYDHGVDADPSFPDAEPSVDALLKQLGGVLGVDTDAGWGAIDDAGSAMGKQRADSMRRMKAEANIFRDTFLTPSGRKCLELMLDQTLRTSPYPPEANLPLDAITALVIVHDAQCNFVRAILAAIAQAENREANRSVT